MQIYHIVRFYCFFGAAAAIVNIKDRDSATSEEKSENPDVIGKFENCVNQTRKNMKERKTS